MWVARQIEKLLMQDDHDLEGFEISIIGVLDVTRNEGEDCNGDTMASHWRGAPQAPVTTAIAPHAFSDSRAASIDVSLPPEGRGGGRQR
jgi:hypothetical protein